MREIVDLERWPLDDLGGPKGKALIGRCREELRDAGMFSLNTLIRPEALETEPRVHPPVRRQNEIHLRGACNSPAEHRHPVSAAAPQYFHCSKGVPVPCPDVSCCPSPLPWPCH